MRARRFAMFSVMDMRQGWAGATGLTSLRGAASGLGGGSTGDSDSKISRNPLPNANGDGYFPGLGSGRSVAWLARLFRVQEVVSSNLTAPTIFFPLLSGATLSRLRGLLSSTQWPLRPIPMPT